MSVIKFGGVEENVVTREEFSLEKAREVLKDETILFSIYSSNKKYPHPLRLIHYYDDTQNKKISFLSNDFDNDAQTIADIYKSRWEIEIFFRTIKQNLKIKRFFGTSSNAVFTQVWVAMIAYLLVSLYKFLNKSKCNSSLR